MFMSFVNIQLAIIAQSLLQCVPLIFFFSKLYIRFEKCESYFDYNVHTFNELLARQFLKEECMAVNDWSCLR